MPPTPTVPRSMIRPVPPLRLLLVALLAGCAAQPTAEDLARSDRRGLASAERSIGRVEGQSLPPAMLGDTPITWDDLRPAMVEAAGPAALDEVVLDRMLDREFAARRLSVSAEMVAEEQRVLMEILANESGSDLQEAQRLVDALRRSRGLGDHRFASLLRRNAMLRALVRDGVQVEEQDVATAYAVRYGPRVRTRVLVVPTQRQGAELTDTLDPTDPHLAMAFADLAARYSTDSSRPRGGSLPPFSLQDPSYPAAATEALRALKPGEMTPPVAVPGGFAVFLLEETIPAPAEAPPLDHVAEALRRQVRVARERLAMDELSRRTLESAPLRVHDRALEAARGK